MRKSILLLIVVIFTTTVVDAQMVQFGAKMGMNLNADQLDITSSGIDDLSNSFKNNTGYHIGLMTRINLVGLYVQGDLLYVRNSYEVNKVEVKENRIDLPVVVGLKLLFVRLYVGPRFNIDLGSDVVKGLDSTMDNLKPEFENRWLGYQAGIGLDLFKKVSIDFNYNGYFKAPNQLFTYDGGSMRVKQKSRQYWISIGYYF